MKVNLLILLAGIGAAVVPADGAFTYETPAELASQGDYNGDGLTDLAVLDRSTGILRILGSLSGVSFISTGHSYTGLDAADSLSSGPSGTGNAVVAIASSTENKVMLATPATQAVMEVDPAGRSTPGAVVIGAASSFLGRPAGQLYVSTDQNNVPTPRQIARYHITPQGPVGADSPSSGQPRPLRHANTVPVDNRTALGFVVAGPDESSFLLKYSQIDTTAAIFVTGGLPSGSLWAQGDFGTQATHRGFLFYRRGTSSFVPCDFQPAGTGAGFTNFSAVDLGAPIHLLVTVEKDGADQLLALFDEGARAVVYDYQIGGQPVMRESWTAPPGEKFTQAAPLANGSFLLLSGPNGRSTKWARYDAEGGLHRRTIAGDFDRGSMHRRSATLFHFDKEPFVNPVSRITQMVLMRDWTDVSTSGIYPLTSLVDQGSRAGLGQGSNFPYTPGAISIITNQFTRTASRLAPVSISTLSNRSGGMPSTIAFDPPAGVYPLPTGTVPAGGDGDVTPYPETFPVKLRTASCSGILYRLSADSAWLNYTSPIPLGASAVIHAKLAGSSQVFSANYRLGNSDPVEPGLTLPPGIDADGDGMPDAWEQAFAQNDPNADTDGDGVTALQEYLNGTDPQDRFSVTPPGVVEDPKLPLAISARTGEAAGQGGHFRVTWSTSLWDARLQGSDDLRTWTPVNQGITIEGNEIVHKLPLSGEGAPRRKFYRLTRTNEE